MNLGSFGFDIGFETNSKLGIFQSEIFLNKVFVTTCMIKLKGLCYICSGVLEKKKGNAICSSCSYNHEDKKQHKILISASAVNQMIKEGKDFTFLDIRTPMERKIAKIERTLFIPMQDIAKKLPMIDRDKEVVVFCHTGGRSFHVARYLNQMGYLARSLDGGIDSWADEIDDSIERY